MNFSRFSILLFVCLYVFFANNLYANDRGICTGDSENVVCLKNNFDELSKNHKDAYYKILNVSARKASKCESLNDVAGFLGLSNINATRRNAEFNEYFGEVVENIVIKNIKCFLDASLMLDDPTLKNLIYTLKHPLFVDDNKITAEFRKYKTKKKYSKITNMYFGR